MKAVVVISDLHIGSSVGLCPTAGMRQDDGGWYKLSGKQRSLARCFENFREWALKRTDAAESRVIVINGDLIDGYHHNTVAVATNNVMIQEQTAIEFLKPVAADYDKTYVVRGTEAHVGKSAQSDEAIARALNCEVDPDTGAHSRWQCWMDVDGLVFNIAHHVGTTSSAAYESSAVMREMVAALVEAGQWEQRLPDVLIRSHRHRYIKIAIPSKKGEIQAAVTPGWQLRTPYIERLDRMRMPHIGGLVIKVEDGRCEITPKIYPMRIPKMETV